MTELDLVRQLEVLDAARQEARKAVDEAWDAYTAAQQEVDRAYAAWWLVRFGEPYPLYRPEPKP